MQTDLSAPESIARAYVRLVLSIDRHYNGYVDGYYGPPEWKAAVNEGEPRPLRALLADADALAGAVAACADLDEQRRDYLAREAVCAQTTLRILQGEPLSLAEEAAGVYDVPIAWIDEAHFEALRQQLSELLGGAGPLSERYAAYEKALRVPAERVEPLSRYAIQTLRQRADELFHLPPGDSVELIFPDAAEPWAGYHDYRGEHHSVAAINAHYDQYLTNFIHILAHETYPGHHTEHSLKEARLKKGLGRMEHCLVMANSPSCVISEGAAMLALETAFDDRQWIDWYEQEIYPRAGLPVQDAARQLQITRAARQIEGLFANAVMLMYDRRASDDEVFAYIRRYSAESDENLHGMLDFMKDRLRRAYTFCYAYGTQLMNDLFAARPDRPHWYLRAISEPATPSQVREWIAQA